MNHIQTDLSKFESIAYIKEKLTNIKLDYIVYSVATEAPLKRFSQISPEEYDYALHLNLKIPFFLTKALLNNLNQNTRILFLTSRLSSSPEEGSLIYCMTKSALEIFSAGLNKELKGKLLTCSIIPGVVDTEMQTRLRNTDPKLFPHAHVYQEMKSKLQPINTVSEKITNHLCDTEDSVFGNQRVTI